MPNYMKWFPDKETEKYENMFLQMWKKFLRNFPMLGIAVQKYTGDRLRNVYKSV